MTDIVFIDGDIAVTSTLAISEGTNVQHKNVIELVRTYLHDLEEFGGVAFETRPFETPGGMQNQEVAVLNEQQSTLLLTYMRNSEVVRAFKKRLVKRFWEMAREIADQKAKAAAPLSPAQMFLQSAQLIADIEQRRTFSLRSFISLTGRRNPPKLNGMGCAIARPPSERNPAMKPASCATRRAGNIRHAISAAIRGPIEAVERKARLFRGADGSHPRNEKRSQMAGICGRSQTAGRSSCQSIYGRGLGDAYTLANFENTGSHARRRRNNRSGCQPGKQVRIVCTEKVPAMGGFHG
ncbi:Rha family transcriptional regulator [Robbsia andropogonis]|uniref:Rha family transcriptional regulator n=1 Tax=Robbsia andropogonis TaxID=28092 RepID=UPI003D238BD4